MSPRPALPPRGLLFPLRMAVGAVVVPRDPGWVRLYCSPELARELHERTPGGTEILWLDTDRHIDLYDAEPYVTKAAEATVAFLARALP